MALGRGLGSLIPTAPKQAIKAAHKDIVISDHSGVREVLIKDIVPNPKQPRKYFDHQELEDLMASIKQHGVLVPLIVTPRKSTGKHDLIAGERRLRASEMLGLS